MAKKYTEAERKEKNEKRTLIMLAARARAEAGEIANVAYKIDGTAYSPYNQCALAVQEGPAGVYGGFRTWLDNGRAVKKGEHGRIVAAPIIKTHKDAAGKVDRSEDEKVGMSWTTIFHIEQTEAVAVTA